MAIKSKGFGLRYRKGVLIVSPPPPQAPCPQQQQPPITAQGDGRRETRSSQSQVREQRPLVIANPRTVSPVSDSEEEENMSVYRRGGHDGSYHQQTNHAKGGSGKEFIPSFVLGDAAKANNERRIREWTKKLANLSNADLEPVVNFQDGTGRTPLSYACSSGNVLIIDELSRLRKVNPNMADNEGNCPLHYAAQAGHSEAIEIVLSRFSGKVDTNIQNLAGLSPLMKAALQGRTRCAKVLIQNGASVHLRDKSRNLTAIEWAKLCGRHITAEVIIRCAIDNYQMNPSDVPVTLPQPTAFKNNRTIPMSQSLLDMKKVTPEDGSLYNILNRRDKGAGGTSWLKSKLKKVLGSSGSAGESAEITSNPGIMSNIGAPTLLASSLLLPSIKPLLEQQQRSKINSHANHSLMTRSSSTRIDSSTTSRLISIPTVCVTDTQR